jgi:septal ring-binding cell division protein DamX
MRGGVSMAVRKAKKKPAKKVAKRKIAKKKAAKKKVVKKATRKKPAKKAAPRKPAKRTAAKAKPRSMPKPKYTCVLCGVEVAITKDGLGISRLMCCGHPMRKK